MKIDPHACLRAGKVVLTFHYSGDDRAITLHEIDGGLGHSIRIPSVVVHQKIKDT